MHKWFFILLIISGSLLAQEPTVSMNFKDVELNVFLKWYANLSNKRILYDRSKLRSKKVYLISPQPVPESKVEDIVLSLLKANGLTIVKGQGDYYNIIETSQASSHPIAIYSEAEIKKIKRGNYYVSQMLIIKHLKASNIINAIKQARLLSPRSSSLVEIRGANAIIVSDFLPNIRRIYRIIKLLDKPAPKARIAFIKIKHVKASDISQKLKQIFQNRAKKLKEYNVVNELTILPDSHTNSLVLSGTKTEILTAKKLIKRFDRKIKGKEVVTKIHRLRYVTPEKILPTLREFINTELFRDDAPNTRRKSKISIIPNEHSNTLLIIAPQKAHELIANVIKEFDEEVREKEVVAKLYALTHITPKQIMPTLKDFIATPLFKEKSTRPGQQRESKVHIAQSEHANSLLITATVAAHRQINGIIKKLDIRRPQVLIESVIAEFTPTDLLSFGIELIKTKNSQNRVQAITSFGLSSIVDEAGNPINPEAPAFPAGRSVAAGPGLTSFYTKDNATDIPILIRAIQSVTDTKVVSIPHITVDSGEQAEIRVQQEEPVISNVNLNSSTSEITFKEFVAAGIVLVIKPQIIRKKWLRLEIEQNVDAFVGAPPAPGIPPAKSSRVIKTVVTVPNKHTIILGGLCSRREIENVDKIPILGDILLIGFLFQSRSRSVSVTNLYVFIKPTIMDSPDFKDLKKASKDYEKRAKNMQEEKRD